MKVLIHALGADMGGAVRHLRGFLPELARQAPDDTFTVLVRDTAILPSWPKNIVPMRHQVSDSFAEIRRLFTDVVAVPRMAREGGYSAVVSLTNYGPWRCKVPHVNFQRNSLFYCPYFMNTLRGNWRPEIRMRRWTLVKTMKGADLIVTPTKAMAEMIRASVPSISGKSFRTLPHGFAAGNYSEPLSSTLAGSFDRPGARVLYPTHLASHKGMDILIKVVFLLKQRGERISFFITGDAEEWPAGMRRIRSQIEVLGLEKDIVFVGRIPQAQIGSAYQQTDLMFYPSLCEAFGFSMIEAMGHNLPIVAADTMVNRELCESAAVYYPPLNAEKGALAVLEALQDEKRQELRAAGKARMSSVDWSWSNYARRFMSLVNEAAERN
jgi:glycosyltransferase involved in cell wall biosynthesis